MRRKNEKQKGAITVFLIIILMACFMFGGFFIDASRILVAKRKVKNALNSAARSTLSYYDEDLVSEYGLYAFDAEKAGDNFKRYFKNNLTKSKDEGMQLFKYTVDESKITVEAQRPLTESELHRQIVEYEKYRAPVSMTLGVVEKIKMVFTGAKEKKEEQEEKEKEEQEGEKEEKEKEEQEGKKEEKEKEEQEGEKEEKIHNATEAIKKMKKDFTDRDGSFEIVKKALKETTKDNIKKAAAKDLSKLTVDWAKNGMKTELEKQYEEANKQIDAAKQKLKELEAVRDEYQKTAEGLCNGQDQTKTDVGNKYIDSDKTMLAQANEQVAALSASIAKAEEILAEVKTGIEGIQPSYVETVVQWEAAKTLLPNAENELNAAKQLRQTKENEKNSAAQALNDAQNAKNKISDYNTSIARYNTDTEKLVKALAEENGIDIYADESFKTYCELTDKGNNRTKDENTKWESIKSEYKDSSDAIVKTVYEIMWRYEEIKNLRDKISKLNTTAANVSALQTEYNTKNNAYTNAANAESEKQKALDDLKARIKSLEDAIKDKQNAMCSLADKLAQIPEMPKPEVTVADMKESVGQIADKVAEYSDLLSIINDSLKTVTKNMSAVETGNKEKVVDRENKGILALIEDVDANIQALKNTITNAENMRNEMYFIDYVMNKCTYLTSQNPRSHYFNAAEVEYIIYGLDNQALNVMAALGSIYMFRFVINTFDNLFTDPAVELVSAIASALGKAAVQSAHDIVNMVVVTPGKDEAAGCDICPSLHDFGMKLTYSDHLRLFMLMNAATSKRALKETMDTTMVKEKNKKPMSQLYTQLSAKVQAEINLIILPMFGTDLLPNNYFRDGRYVINESIVEGY